MNHPVVEKHKIVSLTYVLRDERNNIFEYSDLPVAYLHGSGSELFAKIEESLVGRKAGDKVVVTLAPSEGFGERNPALTFTDDIENVPPELHRVGFQFEGQNARGESLQFTVTHIEDGKLTVDANHPLAGQTVTFEVTVHDIRDPSGEEMRHGAPASTFSPPS